MAVSGTSKNTSMFKGLMDRRVPHIMGFYLAGSWAILQFIDWLVNRYFLSPYLTDIAFVMLLSLIPTAVLLAYFHGDPGKNKWTKVEKIGIPLNLIFTTVLLFAFFQGKDLGAAATNVTVEDEDGKKIERVIPKSEFRKKVALFFFQNQSNDPSLDWLSQGFLHALTIDLLQDVFIQMNNGYEFIREAKQAGFGDGNLPLTLKLKLAREAHSNFVVAGAFKKENQDYVVTTTLYQSKQGKVVAKRTFRGTDVFQLTDEMSVQLKKDLEIPQTHIEESQDLPVSEMLTASRDAFEKFINGLNAYKIHNDVSKGVSLFDEALKKDPQFAFAHLIQFEAYANSNQTEQSNAALQKCMQYLFKLPERIQFQIKSLHYFLKEDTEKRLAVLKMWRELYPEDLEARTALAQYFININDYDRAISEYQEMLKIDPEQFNYIHKVGDLYRQKGDFEEALKHYQQYAGQFPNNTDSFTKIADLYEHQGEHEKAKFYYEKGLVLASDDVSISLNLGDIEQKLGNFEAALKNYEDNLANSKTPIQRAQTYKRLEEYYQLRGQIHKSIDYMNLKWEENAKYRNKLSVTIDKVFDLNQYVAAGKTEQAIKMMEELNPLPPFDKVVALGYLLMYTKLEDAENAEKKLVESEAFLQASGFGFAKILMAFSQGRIYEIREQYKEAIEKYKEYLKMSPERTFANTYIGRSYCKLGEYAEAEVYLQKRLKIFPADPVAHYELALVFAEQGNSGKAIEHLKTALKTWENADPEYKPAKKAREKLAELQA